MLKVFDTEECVIRTAKNPIVQIIEIDVGVLDMPIKEMSNILLEKLNLVGSSGDLYVKVYVTGKCTKEDIEDLYDYVESAITNLHCSNVELDKNKDRLGLFGLPKINIKNVNLLKWIKYRSDVVGIGFEVSKKGSVWKKRMVK